MKITEDVRAYAAEKGIGVEDAVQQGMEEKAGEFQDTGGEIYHKTASGPSQ